MKTLFKKDVRENFKLALIGFGLFALLIFLCCRPMAKSAEQPLLQESLLLMAIYFCSIYAGALGWLQSRNEANRDLWAFLIHRPATRTQIFLGKTAAGLFLYFLGAGLPLLGLICFVALPGRVLAPFETAMVLPPLVILLTGVPFYFAGLLTGLRQARWFASKTFALAAALFSSAAVYSSAVFWFAALAWLFLTVALVIAVWGAYHSGGFYRGQPGAGKASLVVSLTCGGFAVLVIFVGLAGVIISQPRNNYRSKSYCMTVNGQLCVATAINGHPSTFADLHGKAVHDPATGARITHTNFPAAPSIMIGANPSPGDWWERLSNPARFFTFWNIDSSDRSLWFLDRHGKLTGFDNITRRHVGDIAVRDSSGIDPLLLPVNPGRPNSSENPNPDQNPFVGSRLLATRSTIYRVDLANRKLKPLFSTGLGYPIITFAEVRLHPMETNVMLLTSNTFTVFDLNGTPVTSVPRQPGAVDFPQIQVLGLVTNSTRLALWFYPDPGRNEIAGGTLRQHVVWITDGGKTTASIDLPDLPVPNSETRIDKFFASLQPPAIQIEIVRHRLVMTRWSSLVPAALCVLIASFFVQRYRFPLLPAAVWLVFIFAFGIPALLAFFAAQEWPKRETCPNCKKLRTVDRDHCEHCSADFAPPDKIGIEIFEPIASS